MYLHILKKFAFTRYIIFTYLFIKVRWLLKDILDVNLYNFIILLVGKILMYHLDFPFVQIQEAS